MSVHVSAAKIALVRSRLGLTLREFGAMLGCSESRVCHFERGTKSPTGPMLKLLECAIEDKSPQKLRENAAKSISRKSRKNR